MADEKKDALVPQSTALAEKQARDLAAQQAIEEVASDLIADAGRGTENAGEVRPPRLLLCQSGSPYRKPGNAKQIPGLNELDMFNDLSGQNYGTGPLKFVVVNILPVRHMQFAPMEEGGGVIDFDVPEGDPRTQFTTDPETGDRVKPAATTFREFLVWLPDHQDVCVLSLKGSQLGMAERLKGKVKLPLKGELIDPRLAGRIISNPPSWARTFSLTTTMSQKDSYSWGSYNLKDEGLTPAYVREVCRQLADEYKDKTLIIERTPEEAEVAGGDTSFDTAKMEAEGRTVQGVAVDM